MNTQKFSDAMGEINDKYINEALSYKRKIKKRGWLKWGAVAACVCLILAGLFPLFHQPGVSPFVLTAYALESDNTISAAIMQESESVPISLFETESGLKGFVFSYDITEPEQLSYISIMTDGEFPGVVNEITGIDMETDKHYIYYVPEQTMDAPYSLMIPHLDESTVYEFHILIEETESGYSAIIEKIVTFERKEAP